MPESKGRKAAEVKKKDSRKAEVAATQSEKRRRTPSLADNRGWVAPTFVTLSLLGVLWLVVFYITSSVGITIPVFSDVLGSWNVLIGMGLMAASFGLATLWK